MTWRIFSLLNSSHLCFFLVSTHTEFRVLHILINCAAGNFLSKFEDLSVKAFRSVLEIDTMGSFLVTHTMLPLLRRTAAGDTTAGVSVVNITATLHLPATYYQTHAAVAKAGVDALTRQCALEFGAIAAVTAILPLTIAPFAQPFVAVFSLS